MNADFGLRRMNMNEHPTKTGLRRSLLKRAALLVTGMAALPLMQVIARAAEKLQKAAVNYQDKPKDGKDCDDCMHFVVGATPKAMGTCKVVEGAVSPHGYCAAFTPKPKNRS
jgi:hypothetical protein